MPIVDDFHDVTALIGSRWGDRPVVQDQQLHPCQAFQHPCVTPVATCKGQSFQQPRHALVEHRAVIAAGAMTQRTR